MNKFLSLTILAATAIGASGAIPTKTVNIGGTDYEVQTLEERPIGPGMTYMRLRIPEFPLNVNMVKVDTKNEHIRIETTLPNDRSAGTELLVEAAKRQDAPNHHAVAAQNGNFWVVSTQDYWEPHGAMPYGVAMRNGMLSADSKDYPYWWTRPNEQGEYKVWGSKVVGIVGATDENELWLGGCETEMTFKSEKLGTHEISTCNRGFRPGQMTIYTPWQDSEKEFVPLKSGSIWDQTIDTEAQCTEVLCSMADGEQWSGAKDMKFVVKEVRSSNGRGKLGNYDLAVVARTSDFHFDQLVPGDELTINYSWVFDRDGEKKRPAITQAIGGNIHIMQDGQILEHNYWDSYNTMIYSRSAYGTSQDNATLYMVTIDMSSDPVYGRSVGCTTEAMCQLLKEYGVWSLVNVDAGGSAELMVGDRVINTTTEGSPRAVNNGWIVFNTSPDDDKTVAQLAFYDIDLSAPVLGTYTPRVIALNKYGTVINDDYKEFEVTSTSELGYGAGSSFVCGDSAGNAEITITAPGVASATRTLTITESTPHFVLDKIVIDNDHAYMIEVASESNGKSYPIESYRVMFVSDNPEVADVNEHGMLYALKNGTCNINAKVGLMDDTIQVSVENAELPSIELCKTFDDWKVSGVSGLTVGTLGEGGVIPLTYNNPRGSVRVTMAYEPVTIYGLPISFVAEFTSTIPVKSVSVALRQNGETREVQTFEPETGFAADTKHKITIPMTELGDPSYVGLYPLSLANMVFNITPSSSYKGQQQIVVNSVRVVYEDESGVAEIAAETAGGLALSPNPATPGSVVAVGGADAARVEVFNAAGAMVVSIDGVNAFNAPSTAGVYVVKVTAIDGGVTTGRLVVK